MTMRFKTWFFVLVMAVGAVSGTPLQAAAGQGGDSICAMKCCKKAAKAKTSHNQERPNFCRLMTCSEAVPSAPTTNSVPTFNIAFVPSEIQTTYRVIESTKPKEAQLVSSLFEKMPPRQPIYLKSHSFLI